MAQVGRAEVEIVASLSKFGRNLQRDLQKAVDKVKVNADDVGGIRRSLGETERTAARVGRRIGDAFQETFQRVRRVFSHLSNFLFTFRSRILLLGGAITIAMAGIVAALDELGGLLLPLPAILASIGASMATFNVVVRGMSDAFSAAFEDSEKFEESLEGLAPAAQDVAREFRALVPLFRRIGIDVQQAFWEQLDGTLTEVAQNLAGPVRSGMIAVATQMGRIAVEIGEFAASSETARTVGLVFSSTAASMENLVEATQPFLEGMRTLVDIFAPELEGMSATVADLAIRFRDWAEAAEESGSALESARRAAEFLGTLGGIAAGAFRLVAAGVQAAHDAGVDLFETIEELIGAAADLAESPGAQPGLQLFFESIDRLIRALLPLLGTMAVQIGRLATPIADLVEALSPGVAALLEGITTGLIALVDSGGREFAEALSDALIILAPNLEVVGEALGGVLRALSPLLAPLANLVGLLLQIAASVIIAFTPTLELLAIALSSFLTPLLEILLEIAQTALPPLVEAMVELGEAITPFVEELGQQFAEFLMATLPPILEIITQLVGFLTDNIDTLVGWWEFWLDVMVRVYEWILEQVVPVIRDELWPLIRDELIPALQDLWVVIRDELLPALQDLWEELLELVRVIVDEADPSVGDFELVALALRDAIRFVIGVVKAFTTGLRFLIDVLRPVIKFIQTMTRVVRSLRLGLHKTNGVLRNAWRGIKNIIDRGVRLVSVLNDLRGMARRAASAISDIPNLPTFGTSIFDFFAQGGIVNRATAAIIGEAGPEVVLPLSRPDRARELAAESGLMDVLLSGSSNITRARQSARSTGTGAGGGASVVVEEGAVVIRFEGVPDEQRARRIGNAAGEGLLNTLAARNVRLAIRST